jgi:hypothetical protein
VSALIAVEVGRYGTGDRSIIAGMENAASHTLEHDMTVKLVMSFFNKPSASGLSWPCAIRCSIDRPDKASAHKKWSSFVSHGDLIQLGQMTSASWGRA